jgi:ParB/RepB/Spo0J family partition protein
MEVKDIFIFDILEPAVPLRTAGDDDKMAELVESIRRDGLIQPIVVVHEGEKYRIVAGHRRFIAARAAGLSAVPCAVRDATAEDAARLSLMENLAREDVSAVDLGRYFLHLTEAGGMTQAEIAQAIGRSPAHVAQLVALTRLDEELQAAVQQGYLAYASALKLGQIEDKGTRDYYAELAVRHGASFPVVRQWVDDVVKEGWRREPSPEFKAELESLPARPPSTWVCTWCGRPEGEALLEKVWMCRDCLRALAQAKEEEAEK